MLDRGGYTVQPVPAPPSTKLLDNNNINAGGNNQKLMLLSLGKAISGAPIIKGTIQFSVLQSFHLGLDYIFNFIHLKKKDKK